MIQTQIPLIWRTPGPVKPWRSLPSLSQKKTSSVFLKLPSSQGFPHKLCAGYQRTGNPPPEGETNPLASEAFRWCLPWSPALQFAAIHERIRKNHHENQIPQHVLRLLVYEGFGLTVPFSFSIAAVASSTVFMVTKANRRLLPEYLSYITCNFTSIRKAAFQKGFKILFLLLLSDIINYKKKEKKWKRREGSTSAFSTAPCSSTIFVSLSFFKVLGMLPT